MLRTVGYLSSVFIAFFGVSLVVLVFVFYSCAVFNHLLVSSIFKLGYMPKESRLYLCDKDHNIVSYRLLLSVLEYQTAVMRRDFETADRVRMLCFEDQICEEV